MYSTETSKAPQGSSPVVAANDLRSPAGIRWLLFVGALVVVASLVRLTAAEWAAMSPHWKALILIGGSLLVYGLGEVTRYRLRLPVAGSALLGLFAATVPLLAWGAAYRGLLDVPLGWLTVLVGFAALLAASRRLLRLEMDVRGPVYPLALAIFLLALPVLPQLARAFPGPVLPWTATLVLGLVLRAGSRHINRFLFHRDRLAGRDRPLHLLPFAMLSTLFVGAMLLLAPAAPELALPLVILAVALVDTGEEYYRALVAAQGRTIERWPLRSRALLASGFALMAAGMGLAFGAQSLTILLAASICAARLAFWALRYQKPVAYGAALGAGILAWLQLQSTIPGLGKSIPSICLWHLGGLAVLAILAKIAGRQRLLTSAMMSTHASLTAFYALAILLLALFGERALLWVAPLAAAILLLALVAMRRSLLLPALFLAIQSFAVGVNWTFLGQDPAILAQLMALLSGLFVIVGSLGKDRLMPWLDERVLIFPALLSSVCLAILAPYLWGAAASSVILLLAAFTLAESAHRLTMPALFEGAVLALWSGLHLLAWELGGGGYSPFMAIAGQLLFVVFWDVARREPGEPWRRAVRLGLWLGAMSGFAGLALAAASDSFTSEPLTLLLVGAFGIDRLRRSEALGQSDGPARWLQVAALGMIVLYLPLQLLALGWISRPEIFWLMAGATICALRLGGRRLFIGTDILDEMENVWLLFAVIACLFTAGLATFLLAIGAAGVAAWRHQRLPSNHHMLWAITLLPVLHCEVMKLSDHRLLLVALFDDGHLLLPWIALASWLWQLVIDRWVPYARSRAFSLGLDGLIAVSMFALWLSDAALTSPLHVLLLLAAVGRAVRLLVLGVTRQEAWAGWLFQGWAAMAWLAVFNAGWLRFGGLYAGYALLLGAVVEVALGGILERRRQSRLATPTVPIAFALALIAGAASLVAAWTPSWSVSPWVTLFPAFLASLYFLWMALFNHARPLAAVLCSGFFATALLSLFARLGDVPSEFYWLGPGIALVALSRLLTRELGPIWSLRMFSGGALCLYAMPVMGLLDGLTWGWQIALALLALAFGAASFWLRSQSLLVLSTAALLLDLTFFIFKLHQQAPLLIWVLGVVLGLGLMSLAALFEYRREQLLQRLRIWGQKLRAWS